MAAQSVGNSQEIWKPVVGYEGYYEVSSLGRVRSLDRMVSAGNMYGPFMRKVKGRVLSHAVSKGYYIVSLSRRGKHKTVPVHKIVARTFLGSPPGPVGRRLHHWQVNHLDGNNKNNAADNLEWCTHRQNKAHAFENGLYPTHEGERHPGSILTADDVLAIRSRADNGDHYKVIAKDYPQVRPSTVRNIIYRRTWKHL